MYSMTMKSMPVVGADVVDCDDVGMVQRACGPGLLNEALFDGRISDPSGGRTLMATGAIQMGVASLVDDTHAAFTELRFDPVVFEGLDRSLRGGAEYTRKLVLSPDDAVVRRDNP